MRCLNCGSTNVIKKGFNRANHRRYYCHDCGTYFVPAEERGKGERCECGLLVEECDGDHSNWIGDNGFTLQHSPMSNYVVLVD